MQRAFRCRYRCGLGTASMKSALEGDAKADGEDLKSALADFIPPSHPTEIELQNIVAVFECTGRNILPEKYRNMDRSELSCRAAVLATLVS